MYIYSLLKQKKTIIIVFEYQSFYCFFSFLPDGALKESADYHSWRECYTWVCTQHNAVLHWIVYYYCRDAEVKRSIAHVRPVSYLQKLVGVSIGTNYSCIMWYTHTNTTGYYYCCCCCCCFRTCSAYWQLLQSAQGFVWVAATGYLKLNTTRYSTASVSTLHIFSFPFFHEPTSVSSLSVPPVCDSR